MAPRIDQQRARFARTMRHEPTEPEKRLWRELSGSKLSGLKFRRQSVVGPYICDFLCPYNGLIVEVDGDTHDPAKDMLRDRQLKGLGYTVVRVTNEQVMHNREGVLAMILSQASALPERRYRAAKPTPTPPLEGRGE